MQWHPFEQSLDMLDLWKPNCRLDLVLNCPDMDTRPLGFSELPDTGAFAVGPLSSVDCNLGLQLIGLVRAHPRDFYSILDLENLEVKSLPCPLTPYIQSKRNAGSVCEDSMKRFALAQAREPIYSHIITSDVAFGPAKLCCHSGHGTETVFWLLKCGSLPFCDCCWELLPWGDVLVCCSFWCM